MQTPRNAVTRFLTQLIFLVRGAYLPKDVRGSPRQNNAGLKVPQTHDDASKASEV